MLTGSPPRLRGLQEHTFVYIVGIGITPASAGTTLMFNQRGRVVWDHPRVCGDYTKHICNSQRLVNCSVIVDPATEKIHFDWLTCRRLSN